MCLRLSQEPTLSPGVWTRGRERERVKKKKMVKPPHIHSRAGVLSRRKLNWGRREFTVRTALERSGREVTMSSWCFFRRFKSGEEAY